MNASMTTIILASSIVLEIVLELRGIKVPTIVYLLSGFAVRHIIGADTAKDDTKPVISGLNAPSGIITQTKPIVEEVKP